MQLIQLEEVVGNHLHPQQRITNRPVNQPPSIYSKAIFSTWIMSRFALHYLFLSHSLSPSSTSSFLFFFYYFTLNFSKLNFWYKVQNYLLLSLFSRSLSLYTRLIMRPQTRFFARVGVFFFFGGGERGSGNWMDIDLKTLLYMRESIFTLFLRFFYYTFERWIGGVDGWQYFKHANYCMCFSKKRGNLTFRRYFVANWFYKKK